MIKNNNLYWFLLNQSLVGHYSMVLFFFLTISVLLNLGKSSLPFFLFAFKKNSIEYWIFLFLLNLNLLYKKLRPPSSSSLKIFPNLCIFSQITNRCYKSSLVSYLFIIWNTFPVESVKMMAPGSIFIPHCSSRFISLLRKYIKWYWWKCIVSLYLKNDF